MKVIIAGSRNLNSLYPYSFVESVVEQSEFQITEVVSGGCRGADAFGEIWARANNLPTKIFSAEWKKYGKAAGPIRNEEMAKYADALIAIRVNHSKGTSNMIKLAKKYNLKTYIVELP